MIYSRIHKYNSCFKTVGDISTVQEFVDLIKKPSTDIIELICEIRSCKDKKKRLKLKRKLPAFNLQFHCECLNRNCEAPVMNNIVVLDYDELCCSKDELERLKAEFVKEDFVLACFVSPSGNGLKVLCMMEYGCPKCYRGAYEFLSEYFKKLGLQTDPSQKQMKALCFISYDPEIYVNPYPKMFEL